MSVLMLLRLSSAANSLLLSVPPNDAFDSLMTWLTARDIAFVEALPPQNGLFCTQQAPSSYLVFQSVWVSADNMFIPTLLYTLQWIPWNPAVKNVSDWEQIPAGEKI